MAQAHCGPCLQDIPNRLNSKVWLSTATSVSILDKIESWVPMASALSFFSTFSYSLLWKAPEAIRNASLSEDNDLEQ